MGEVNEWELEARDGVSKGQNLYAKKKREKGRCLDGERRKKRRKETRGKMRRDVEESKGDWKVGDDGESKGKKQE